MAILSLLAMRLESAHLRFAGWAFPNGTEAPNFPHHFPLPFSQKVSGSTALEVFHQTSKASEYNILALILRLSRIN
jgi:hypothetical protein